MSIPLEHVEQLLPQCEWIRGAINNNNNNNMFIGVLKVQKDMHIISTEKNTYQGVQKVQLTCCICNLTGPTGPKNLF